MIKEILKIINTTLPQESKRILSTKSEEIDIENDEKFEEQLQNLMDTAEDNKDNCAGLAFNQIGILKCGFVMKAGKNPEDKYRAIINPEYIMKGTSKKSREEGCLSRPGLDPIKVRRSNKVKIKFYDPELKETVIETFYAFWARVIQHEMDHLRGKIV